MRDRHAQLWRKGRQALRDLPPGPRAAIKRYRAICGCPGDPVYLVTIIHEHRAGKVCYWHVMALPALYYELAYRYRFILIFEPAGSRAGFTRYTGNCGGEFQPGSHFYRPAIAALGCKSVGSKIHRE